MEQHIRQAWPGNEAALFELKEDDSKLITQADCTFYYRHIMSFLTRWINKQEITVFKLK